MPYRRQITDTRHRPQPQPPVQPPVQQGPAPGMLPIGAPGSDMQTFGTNDIPGYMPGMGYQAIKGYYDYLNQQREAERQKAGFEGDYGGWSLGEKGYNPTWSPGTVGMPDEDEGGESPAAPGVTDTPPLETPQGKPILSRAATSPGFNSQITPGTLGGATPTWTLSPGGMEMTGGGSMPAQRSPITPGTMGGRFPRRPRTFGGYPGASVYGGGGGGSGYGGSYGQRRGF
jgi:hypothetical protein